MSGRSSEIDLFMSSGTPAGLNWHRKFVGNWRDVGGIDGFLSRYVAASNVMTLETEGLRALVRI